MGEKLAEPHVRGVLDRLLDGRGLAPAFTLLVPVDERPPRYRWYVQAAALEADPAAAPALAAALEAGLGENPHYAYARRLGQLAAAEVATLTSRGRPGWEALPAGVSRPRNARRQHQARSAGSPRRLAGRLRSASPGKIGGVSGPGGCWKPCVPSIRRTKRRYAALPTSTIGIRVPHAMARGRMFRQRNVSR